MAATTIMAGVALTQQPSSGSALIANGAASPHQICLPQPLLFAATVGVALLDLHGFQEGSFGVFELAKPVDVEIQTGFDVRWVDVCPRSAHVTPTISKDHQSVRFRMTGLIPLTIEFNDDLSRVVHLFPHGPEQDALDRPIRTMATLGQVYTKLG